MLLSVSLPTLIPLWLTLSWTPAVGCVTSHPSDSQFLATSNQLRMACHDHTEWILLIVKGPVEFYSITNINTSGKQTSIKLKYLNYWSPPKETKLLHQQVYKTSRKYANMIFLKRSTNKQNNSTIYSQGIHFLLTFKSNQSFYLELDWGKIL